MQPFMRRLIARLIDLYQTAHRIRLIPFKVEIPEKERDPDLGAKLADELPGILNWALRGYERWKAEGLARRRNSRRN